MTTAPPVTAPLPSLTQNPDRASAGFWPTTAAVAARTIRKFVRTPQLIVMNLVQTALWLLIFRYIFGGAIDVKGLNYVDFLVPGVIVTTALFSGMGGAAGIAEDVEQGFFDRLRSLPIPRTAVLAGRCIADTLLVAGGLAVGTALGFAIGFRTHSSVGDSLAGFGLCVLFTFALEWVFITIGLVAGTAQAAQGMSMLVVPFTFVSSAYVPIDSMPGWLQAVGNNQPITLMVNAVRGLVVGDKADALLAESTSHYVGLSLIWSAAIIVVFAVLSGWRFSRR